MPYLLLDEGAQGLLLHGVEILKVGRLDASLAQHADALRPLQSQPGRVKTSIVPKALVWEQQTKPWHSERNRTYEGSRYWKVSRGNCLRTVSISAAYSVCSPLKMCTNILSITSSTYVTWLDLGSTWWFKAPRHTYHTRAKATNFVVVLDERHLEIESHELGQVAMGERELGAEDCRRMR